MGVDINFVVMYGVRLTGDDCDSFYDSYNEWYDGDEPEDFSFVMDGMSGEYCLLGHQLAYMDHYGGDADDETGLYKIINFQQLDNYRTKIIKSLKQKFPQHTSLFDKPWDIIAQVHFT